MTVEEKNRFEKVEGDMRDMRRHSYTIEKKVDEILTLLRGDGFGNEGMVEKVNRQGARIKKLENFKIRATWMLAGASLPTGYGIWEFLKKIFPPLAVLILIN